MLGFVILFQSTVSCRQMTELCPISKNHWRDQVTEVDLQNEAGIGVDPALEAFLCHFLTFVSAFLHAAAVHFVKNAWPCTFTVPSRRC